MLSLVLAMAACTIVAVGVAAQSPSPMGGDVAGPVDPRSSGEGPGLRAEPLLVLAAIALLGLAAAGGTALYVRVTRED